MQPAGNKVKVFYQEMAQLPRSQAGLRQREVDRELPLGSRLQELQLSLVSEDEDRLGVFDSQPFKPQLTQGIPGIGWQVPIPHRELVNRAGHFGNELHSLIAQRPLRRIGMPIRGNPTRSQIPDKSQCGEIVGLQSGSHGVRVLDEITGRRPVSCNRRH